MEQRQVVFYDGDCGLCNRVVQFILKNEKTDSVLFFSALQSSFATRFFADKKNPIQLNTFYFFDGNELSTKSKACFQLLNHLSWYWKFLYFGKIMPRFFADKVYDFVAKHRNKFFTESCMITQEQQDRFLA